MAAVQDTEARPPLTGWLRKRKNDNAKSRLLKTANRRFFTVDFEAQIFYYAHSEGKKTVSMPAHFRHLLSAEPFAATEKEPEEDNAEEDNSCPRRTPSNGSGGSKKSLLQRMPSFSSFSKRPPVEQHGFIVRIMHGRSMELLCESKDEAALWISALREGIALAKDVSSEEALKGEISTAPGSEESASCSTSPRSSSHSCTPRDGTADTVTGPLEPEQRPPRGPPTSFMPTPRAAGGTVVEGVARASESSQSLQSFASSPRSAAGGTVPQKATKQIALVIPPRSARSTASGDKRSPRQGHITAVLESSASEQAASCWGAGHTKEAKLAARYSDKGEGMSINQRLSQMEFSDDENDSEAEQLRHVASVDQDAGNGLGKTAEAVTLEACENFVAPDSDTE